MPFPTLKNPFEQILITIALCGMVACSDPQPIEPTNSSEEPKRKEETTAAPKEPELAIPIVLIEELDQYQEFYKEQHTTSLSHAHNKNWFSFRAGKDGILTKILLYGKPTVRITAYYGNSMSGFIREGNPTTGPKYGAWELSRNDILNQLAAQSLTEDDSGWITINMRGQIPQEIGKTRCHFKRVQSAFLSRGATLRNTVKEIRRDHDGEKRCLQTGSVIRAGSDFGLIEFEEKRNILIGDRTPKGLSYEATDDLPRRTAAFPVSGD